MNRVVSLFDLASDVVRKSTRAASGQITVVPIVVDDLKAAMPVLAALSTVNEGRLLSTDEPDLQTAVPGTTDAVRRAAITRALTGRPTTPRYVELLDKGDGMVDAAFADPATDAPSQGEQEVLAVARAIAHRDLDAHRFVVVAYREHLLDLPFKRAIWSLVVDQLSGMRHTTLRTLVVVAEGAIDIALHCETGRGFQLAIAGTRLLRRRSADDLNLTATLVARHPGPLARTIHQTVEEPGCGAGATRPW